MTICILFHQSNYKNFKAFYLEYVIKQLCSIFPKLVSYNRFVELKSSTMSILAAYLTSKFDKPTGISYIDSTPIIQGGFDQACKEALTKKGIKWELSTAAKEYAGLTTQVPARTSVRLKSRYRGTLSFGKRKLIMEKQINAR